MNILRLFRTPAVFSPNDLHMYRKAQLINFWLLFGLLILCKTMINAFYLIGTDSHSINFELRFFSRLIWIIIVIATYCLFKIKHMVGLASWVASLSVILIVGELAYQNSFHASPMVLLVPIVLFPLIGLRWGGSLYSCFAVFVLFIVANQGQVEGLYHPKAMLNNHFYALILGGGAAWFLELGKTEVIDKLHNSATRDFLTQCWNRNIFFKSLDKEISKAKRTKRTFSLVIFDIDHFKGINDQYGHMVGDVVLTEFVNVINKHIRKSDVFARIGGEEFALLLPNAGASEALKKTDEILAEIRKHKYPEVGVVTSSAGITEYRPGYLAKDLLNNADTGLYKAKSQGRDRALFCDQQMP